MVSATHTWAVWRNFVLELGYKEELQMNKAKGKKKWPRQTDRQTSNSTKNVKMFILLP